MTILTNYNQSQHLHLLHANQNRLNKLSQFQQITINHYGAPNIGI